MLLKERAHIGPPTLGPPYWAPHIGPRQKSKNDRKSVGSRRKLVRIRPYLVKPRQNSSKTIGIYPGECRNMRFSVISSHFLENFEDFLNFFLKIHADRKTGRNTPRITPFGMKKTPNERQKCEENFENLRS